MKNIFKYAFLNSFLTALYVVVVASFMFFMGSRFPGEDIQSVLTPITILMLLVFSVALVGTLMFGRPVLWYMDGKKKEAVVLLFYTLGLFFLITVLAFLVLLAVVF